MTALKPLVLALAIAITAGPALLSGSPAQAVEATDVAPAVARVAIVMPLTAPITDPAVVYVAPAVAPVAPTLMDAETLAYYTSPTGLLTTQLDAIVDSGVTIGIDPLIIASIRALGTTAPVSARQWLDRLENVGNDTFPLAFADADLTAPIQAGRRSVVRVTSLDYAIDPTLFAPVSTAVPSPGTQPDPNALPPLPTTADLLAWNYTLPALAWPRADTVVANDLKVIGASFDSTLLSSGNVTRSADTSARVTVGSRDVLVADEAVSTLVDGAVDATSVDEWNAAMSLVGTSLAAIATQSSDSTVVLTLDRTAPLPTSRLTATVAAIGGLENADIVGLREIAASTSIPATLVKSAQPKARIARTKTLLMEESRVADFATIAENPLLITGERRARILTMLSWAAERQPGGWGVPTTAYLDESAAILDSVKLERSSDIVLLADRESIRPAVTNNLGQTVTVYVEVRALNPNLTIPDRRVKLTIKKNSQGKASVPVESVSNGQVEVAIRLENSDNQQLGTTEHLKVTVQAGWEGPFTLVSGIVVLLVFAFGIARSVIRRRRLAATPDGER